MSQRFHHIGQPGHLQCRSCIKLHRGLPSNAAKRTTCRTSALQSHHCWRVVGTAAAAVHAAARPAHQRRHCVAWAASSNDKQTPQPTDDLEEYEEGEWEEFEEGEWEEFEEYEEGEEEEEDSAAAVSNVTQIPMEQQTVQYTPDDFVDVGLITRAHGIKGEVKVQLITDEPKKRLGTAGKRLWLQPAAGRGGVAVGSSSGQRLLQKVTVQWGRVARPQSRDRQAEWAVKFNEVPNRDKAETLQGCRLLLALCDREAGPRSKDEFFITDLVGLKAVVGASQQLLGIVTEVYDSASSYSLLRVRLAPNEADIQGSKYRSVLVPFVEDMVPSVDVAEGQLQLDLPEGLLETATVHKLKRPYTPDQQAQLRKQLLQRQQQPGTQ